ncbi:MAG TPA: hypothetical protein VMT67_05570 [Terriglobales bacterium]|nr:hypothetical protein [Terriglobales bacterium]
MPLALLLSPDDQAVAAITSVLEEMSVTWERPLDGASAAQKLNSNRFDLVLVDCENLAAAKLIFDVCRNRKGGSHPVPVAVVDGRAGLPTAFRLGAELILTKPVAKDQARVTIRTAISRVRKEESARADSAVTPQQDAAANANLDATSHQPAEQSADDAAAYVAPEGRAFAAAVGSQSPASFSEPASASTPSMSMSAAVAEPGPAEPAVTTKGTAAAQPASGVFASAESDVAERKDVKEKSAQAVAEKPEEKAETKLQPAEAAAPSEEKISGGEEKSEPKKTAPKAAKSHGRVITLFVLLVACGGFYAAWTYEPGFQGLVKTQINNALRLIGKAPQQPQPAPAPVRPAAQTPKPSAGVPVQVAPAAQPAGATTTTPDLSATPAGSSTTVPSTATTQPVTTQPAATAATPATSTGLDGTKPAVATPSQPPVAPTTKPGVTRIDLSPSATAEPAKRTRPSAQKPPQPEH